MHAYPDDIARLSAEAYNQPDGPTKVAILEEAVRIADSRHDLDSGFAVRKDLITAASNAGLPEVKILAFSWCLSQFDSDRQRFGDYGTEHDLLWKYKWVVGGLTSFPQITKVQIFDMLADMSRRYESVGSTLHAVYDEERSITMSMGDEKACKAAHKKLLKTLRDHFSNCPACVQDRLVSHFKYFGKYEKAYEAAKPILEQRMRCATVPHRTYGKIMWVLYKLDRLEEAMKLHRKGYPMIATSPGHITYIDDHIEFLIVTDNLTRAVKLTEKHFPMAFASSDPSTRYYFFKTVLLLMDCLRDTKTRTVKMHFPNDHPLYDAKDRVPVADFYTWLLAECQSTAAAYDARNGNDVKMNSLNELPKLKKEIKPFPFLNRG